MIKVNVITKNYGWKRYIKDPNNYIDKKIKKLNLNIKKFSKTNILCTLLLSDNKQIRFLNKKFRKKK